ncbi:DUF4145 domain-containing protein [Ralstonia sp. 3PA37C10]|jgi:hypothetical protein|uniref:DUF4145 domain-containing protein n=1 Tax=Ralstonia TaxID=48736 RepID=UPI0010F4603A|nr:DUF4145 domain-containing protein [Ralstonia sp. 3PA37C10]
MSELVADCPRCGARHITFDLTAATWVGQRHQWQNWYEAFCVCRRCHRSTVFGLAQGSSLLDEEIKKHGLNKLPQAVNNYFSIEGHVSQKDEVAEKPPEHLPPDIDAAFREGATCMAVSCYNAAATMFRLCLDFSTRSMLPADNVDGLNSKIRFSLGLRLQWLFDTGRLPNALQELASCVKDDGNDGAHEGTLGQADAEDLHDFTVALLERLYTEPARLAEAKARREARRK